MASTKATLILSGLGLNCENETAHACKLAGASTVDVVHTLAFLQGQVNLKDYDFLLLIGGFLDGDYLGSARVGVNRFRFHTGEANVQSQFTQFIAEGKLILGICNGFQLLVKLGILPDTNVAFKTANVSLTHNDSTRFENRWSNLAVNPDSPCIFTKNIDQIYLPIRHGEGKLVVTEKATQNYILENNLNVLSYADVQGNITSQYPDNPNGSWENVAALTNTQGNVLGLMPHPEAFIHYTQHPDWTNLPYSANEEGAGLQLFKNAYTYLNN